MAIKLNDLSAMLDEHFRLAPPLDSQYTTASGAIREFGDGVSLGDGTSMANVRGLENIQVVEKANSFDKVRHISMKDWMEKTIRENPNPEAVAGAVQNLLENGQMSYFEQGREFANQLHMDPETKELYPAIVAEDTRHLPKPELTFKQKLFRLFGAFKGEEAEKYNRDLLSYELQQKALATSKARVPVGAGIVLENDDGKGRVLVDGVDMTKALRNIELRRTISQLSPEVQKEVKQEILSGENAREVLELKIGPTLNEKKFFAQRYPNGKPNGINTIDDHVKSIVAKQRSFGSFGLMKDQSIATMASVYGPMGYALVANFLCEVMEGKEREDFSEKLIPMMKTEAFKSMFGKPDVLLNQIKTGKIFDQFARNLMTHPTDLFEPHEIENLLDVCIEPHKTLSSAAKAAKKPDILGVANNKQLEKQIQKPIEKDIQMSILKEVKRNLDKNYGKKPNGPKFG